MFELLILAVLLFIGVSGYRSYRQRRANKQAMITPSQPEKVASPGRLTLAKDWVVGKSSSVRNTFSRKAQPDPVQLLRAWAAESLNQNKGLQNWITTLSDNGAQALTQQLIDFCHNLNVELMWLLDKGLEKDPELKQTIGEIAVGYATACWKAAQAQEDLKTYQSYLSLLENPTSKENRVLSQSVFTELVKRGLTPAVKAELFLATDKERQEHVLEAIKKAAEKDRKAFNQVLSTVIFNTAKGEATPAAEVQPVAAAA